MAIWSLTQERIDRLKKQIGDKEQEYKQLSDTTPKDLWRADLDEFIDEWHKQLEEEAGRRRKNARQGRRASAKLRIGGGKPAGRKRKGAADSSDDEFEVKAKTKKTTADVKPKASSMLSYLNKPQEKPATASKISSAFGDHKPEPMNLDGASSDIEMFDAPAKPPKTEPAEAKPAKKPAAKKQVVLSDDDDDDVFAAVANEAKPKKSADAARQPRRAAAKAVTYTNNSSDMSDSDGNGDDLLGDVSSMVKGLPKTTASASNNASSKPLFKQTTSRPSSSSSAAGRGMSLSRGGAQDDKSDEETDYARLMPQGSPEKPAPRRARDIDHSDVNDASDDDIFAAPKATKAAPKPAAKPLVKAKKAPSAAPEPKEKKPVVLSPAAKAYAKKLQAGNAPPAPKLQAAAPKGKAAKKKTVESDSEDGAEQLANEILDDEDEEEPVGKPAARPARRAAAAKPKVQYMDEDDSLLLDDDDESEADFDDDDDD